MAGVVAMASVIEDFETQPCKKSGKDSGSPVVKTITNYFSPVPKPAEKPFSPPRSNNIMDYFNRKVSLSKDKDSSPEQSKKNEQMSQLAEKDTNHLPQKRRKASRAARKLVATENISSTSEENNLNKEEQHESKDSAARSKSSCGILGSDTAALLVRLSAEACLSAGTLERNGTKAVSLEQAERDENDEDESPKHGKHVRSKPETKCTELSPSVPSKEKPKKPRAAARNSRKVQQQKTKDTETEEKEGSLCDVDMEVKEGDSSQVNSMVTVSYEDFLQSQSQEEVTEDITNKQVIEEDNAKTTVEEEMDAEPMEKLKAEENVPVDTPLQVSPRTLTIQAEVHAVSHKQDAAKVNAKLASIFNRRKGSANSDVLTSPCQTEAQQQQLPASPLAVKRKSNVVLQEEDLELAVLDSESVPKCREAERKQFMAAFKQPNLDGSKIKPTKSQSKQKQDGEGVLEQVEKVSGKVSENPLPADQEGASPQENKSAKKKPAKKDKRRVDEEKASTQPDAPAPLDPDPDSNPDPTREKVITIVESHEEDEECQITSAPSTPAVRRSRREAVIRQTPEATLTTPVRKTRKCNEPKDAAAVPPDQSPGLTTTTKRRRTKHGVFVAEITCPPDTKQSPIRIKFTRVHKNVSIPEVQSGSGLNTSVDQKVFTDAQKKKRVKKLVEKAKVIQHGKKTDIPLRRSSRAEANTKKNFCEDEDSVICVDDDQPAPPKAKSEKLKTQKSLRSLNDVLGKAAPGPGSRISSPGVEKPGRKVSAVISIFDDSSRDCFDSTQDDEQFRARRDFLKSGLPESFRKQIAKTAASKEAYSLSCSSFQLVVHIKQQTNDCPFWSLSWPESLGHLRSSWSLTCGRVPPVCGPVCVRTEPNRTAFSEQGSGWRPEIPENIHQRLLEEVRASNPPFPVQMFMSRFLKRRSDHQQQQSSVSEPGAESRVPNTSLPSEPIGGKRKRRDDGEGMTVKAAKRKRSSSSEIPTPDPGPAKRGGRSIRGQRSRQEDKPSVKAAPVTPEDGSAALLHDVEEKDVLKEDVLWTDKYQPQNSTDIIGNSASVRRLHSWLKEWKLRVDREERKKQKEQKQEEGSNDSDWDCGEDDSQDGEDILCNTMLITGPSGVGKTAAVYACAQELGFKVFEVNASSQRSGRLILSQLKEATQSHQVDSQGVNAHKPTYFNCYSTSSSTGSLRPGSSPRKINSPRRAVSSPRKTPQSPRGAKRGRLAPTSLANFFKGGQHTNKEAPSTKKNEQTAAVKKPSKKPDHAKNSPNLASTKEKASEEQSRRTATSLILFEEVDVIFDDDSGFLSAIKTFMTTTKRPVVLTTSDPSFSAMFDGIFEEIIFQTPSSVDVSSFLRLLCLTEDVRTEQADISSLLRLNGCDIRQSLLQLQLWTRSGGGRRATGPTLTAKNDEEASLPPCDLGCAQSMLGLLNIEPEREVWELLMSQTLLEGEFSSELLTSCRRRGVDLLYSNMEMLLPLPRTQLTTSTYKPSLPAPTSQSDPPDAPPSHARSNTAESADCSDDSSPVKMSHRMRKKRRHSLPEEDKSHSDSEETFLSLKESQGAPPATEEHAQSSVLEKVKRTPLTPEERVKSLPVSQCLKSLAAFFDDMSCLDSFLSEESTAADPGQRKFGAVIKDGMNDEPRVEMDRGSGVRRELVSEMAAAVEALSFSRCRVSVAETWDKAQKVDGELGQELAAELRLPLAAHRERYSLSVDVLCHPQLVQQRSEVLESLTVKGAFGSLGNRTAAALDYLPAVRTICRSEQLKEQGKVKRRFLHYLDAIGMGVEKSTLQHLAKDFP
ncbi:ATPase family AAA domain-containing protein 5 [Halichoeres trimaculatus]|uniref:ATPase family AAA domain-containing protein 5 n=1 Tax=Halichoeres trimaculatus TaxID=147232 RepID=UPI003D9F319E